MKHLNIRRGARFALAGLVIAFTTTACFNTFHGDDDKTNDEAAVSQQIFVIVAAEATESAGATPGCSSTADEPITLVSQASYSVPAGAICYFKYTSDRGGNNPTFTLNTTSGNADLYIDYKNDSTGGTTGATDCTTTTTGGGWDRCSRNAEGQDRIDTNEAGILTMQNGDFRLIGVYGAGSGASAFSLEATQ